MVRGPAIVNRHDLVFAGAPSGAEIAAAHTALLAAGKGAARRYDWRDVVRLAVVEQLRRIPLDTGAALGFAGNERHHGLAPYETLPSSPLHWIIQGVDHDRSMSFRPADTLAASLAEARTILVVDVAAVGRAALCRLGAGSGARAE